MNLYTGYSACIGTENHWNHKIIENLSLNKH